MKIEHLVVTMNQKDFNLYSRMKLKCNAVIANQYNTFNFNEKRINDSNVKMITTNTKGVGINRNIGIMYSSADLCILSDDDMEYHDNYIETIKKAFEKLPDADIIIFNIKTSGNSKVKRRKNTKIKRINRFNFMNYGAARVVFKRNSVINSNIWFSLQFGGGTKYSSGEDTLFLSESLEKKLKIYAFPEEIATVDQTTSTWFNDYNEKFFYDKGALIGQIHPILKYLYIYLYFPYRFKSKLDINRRITCLSNGMKNYKKNISYDEWRKNTI